MTIFNYIRCEKTTTKMIKKQFLSAIIIFLTFNIFAQKTTQTQTLSTNVRILVQNVSLVKMKFDTILFKNNWITNSYNRTTNNFDVSIILKDSSKYMELLKTVKSWGVLVDESTSASNGISEVYSKYVMNEALKKERDQYEILAGRTEVNSVRYYDYWEKIIAIDKTIASNEIAYRQNPKNEKEYSLSMHFFEEEVIGTDYAEAWINMPGLEYSMLFTEQPKSGMSSSQMTGYHLKYMFNYRKSYFQLGLFQSTSPKTLTEVNEIYTFSLGQDFYSRTLGRGRRKFLNLYTSISTGVLMASSDTDKYKSWFLNPYLGLEIFKNKHILLDNKVGYFLPFTNNRNQRGLLYSVSFNFVF